MSVAAPRCEKCACDRRFDRVAPYAAAVKEQVFAVTWRCPSCDSLALDLCPRGPLVPSPASCLNCGGEFPGGEDDPKCPDCGMPGSESATFLGLDAKAVADPVPAAQERFRSGLYRSGLALLNRAVQRNPSLVEAWQEKAHFLQSLGYYDSSVGPLERAISAGGQPQLRISRAVAFQETGRFQQAVEAYDEFVSMFPKSELIGVAYCNQANAYVKLQNAERAEPLFNAAIKVDPSRPSHYFNYYLLLSEQRRWAEMLDVLERGLPHAATSDPLRPTMLAEKAWVLAELERSKDALEAADEALRLAPENAKARYMRGRALAALGRLGEARLDIERVLATKPENADAKRAIKMIDDALAAEASSAAGKPSLWRRLFGRGRGD